MSDDRVLSPTFSATVAWDRSGLIGTIGFCLAISGDTIIGRTTSGIVEYPSGGGIYTISGLACPANGAYQAIWDDGTLFVSGDIQIDRAEGHKHLELYDPTMLTLEAAATDLRVLANSPELASLDPSSPDLVDLDIPELVIA